MNSYRFKGPIMFLTGSLLFAVMGVLTKLATTSLPVAEIALVRFLFGICILLLLARTGVISLSSDRKGLLVARGIFGGLSVILFYLAIGGGSLTNATVLNNTYPLFATLFAAYFLREKLRPLVLLPLGAALVGMVLMTNPDFSTFNQADLYGLASGILGGVAIVVIKELRNTETAWVVFFYFNLFGAVFSGFLAVPNLILPSQEEGLLLLSAATISTVAQLLHTWAYKYSTASAGSILTMSTAVFAALFSVFLLGDKLTWTEIAGAMLIISASTILAAGFGINKKAGKSSCPVEK